MTGSRSVLGSFLIAFVVCFGIFAIVKLIGVADELGWFAGLIISVVVGVIAAVASLARRGRQA